MLMLQYKRGVQLYEFSLQLRFPLRIGLSLDLFYDLQCCQRSKVKSGEPQIGDGSVIASFARLFLQAFRQSDDCSDFYHRSLIWLTRKQDDLRQVSAGSGYHEARTAPDRPSLKV